MDFPTLLAELQYWLDDISQPFGVNGEKGIDVGLPYHTPVYAVAAGPVLGAGFYGGGGVVSTEADPTHSIYYQHLSDLAVSVGQQVKQGQLIGWSGGQIGYGDHPSSRQFSTGPHIEIGVNGPWGGMWDPLGPNINPVPYLSSLLASGGSVGTFGGGGPTNPSSPVQGAPLGFLSSVPSIQSLIGVNGWKDLLWRGLLIFIGVALLLIAVHGVVAHAEDEEAGTTEKTAVPAAPATVTVAEAE